jgi:hypothetical protein
VVVMGRKRKRAVKTFSGSPTDDLMALSRALAEARSARVTRSGYLIYAVDPDADVLADETEKYVRILSEDVVAGTRDRADLDELRSALAVSSIEGFDCMCSGDFAIEFLDAARLPVEVVRFDVPGSVECTLWYGKARLTDPERLLAWLARHGVAARP